MRKLLIASLIIVFPSFTFAAGDAATGQEKSAICATCHGANGIAIVPIYPNLKGQNGPYLVGALKAYKSGQRNGGLSAVMAAQVASLSDADMEDLAAYYSSMK